MQGIVSEITAPLTPIESWRQTWFGNTADSGVGADTNILTSDGMPNLLKYALGLDPLLPADNPVSGEISGGFLRLNVPRNPSATDVSFFIEGADNLNAPGWSTNNTVVDQDTPSLLRAHHDAPVSINPSAFMRLRVTRP